MAPTRHANTPAKSRVSANREEEVGNAARVVNDAQVRQCSADAVNVSKMSKSDVASPVAVTS